MTLATSAPASSMGRSIVTGAVLGVVILFIFGGVLGRLAGTSSIDSIGLGAFAAAWGGLGFGAMMGGAVHMMREEKRNPDGH